MNVGSSARAKARTPSLRMPSQSEARRDQASRLRLQIRHHHSTGGNAARTPSVAHLFAMEENAAERQPLSPIPSPASRSTAGGVGNEAVTTSTPDASTTSSRKRSISSRSDGRASQEPASKRQRTSDTPENTSPIPIPIAEPQPQPESWDDLITARPYTKPLFDDEPMQLLQRSAALVLHHVGFDSASKEALESLCAQASACMYPGRSIKHPILILYRCRTVSFMRHRVHAFFTQSSTHTSRLRICSPTTRSN